MIKRFFIAAPVVLAIAGFTACDPFGGCCKTCSKGKACGDSYISNSYTCHEGKGCACD